MPPSSEAPAAPAAPHFGAPATTISWRERRRSRMAELVDGGAMLFSDVAMIRTLVIVVVMWIVAFFARRTSSAAMPLVISAGLFFVAETINTIVEMLVDRISLEANVFSARIKHASAFLSACVGTVAFLLLFLVGYHMFFKPSPDAEKGRRAGTEGLLKGSSPMKELGGGPASSPTFGLANCSSNYIARPTQAAPSLRSELQVPPPRQELHVERSEAAAGPSICSGGSTAGGQAKDDAKESSEHAPVPACASSSPSSPSAVQGVQAPAPEALAERTASSVQFIRWLREGSDVGAPVAASQVRTGECLQFASRHVMHPMDWDKRVAKKKRLRRRKLALAGGGGGGAPGAAT